MLTTFRYLAAVAVVGRRLPFGIMLHRELYRGTVVWIRTQATQRGGTEQQQQRAERDWLRIEAPELRIISEELWERVQVQLAQARHVYLRATGGQLHDRLAASDRRSRYLLSRLATCGVCGGSIVSLTRAKGRHIRKVYGCAHYHERGGQICANHVQIRQEALDAAVLQRISDAFDDSLIRDAIDPGCALIEREQGTVPDRRMALQRDLAAVETRLRYLVEAIRAGRGARHCGRRSKRKRSGRRHSYASWRS